MDYGNAWFALLWQEIFYQVVIDYNSVNISTMYAFVHSRYSLICIGIARVGTAPPPISNQYIDSVEQLNYCLVFWILATFVSTTKVFLVWYQTNTCCPSDPKWCYLVVSTKSLTIWVCQIPLWQTHWTLKRLEWYLQTVFWIQHGGWHVGQFAGHHSPLHDKTQPIVKNVTWIGSFWQFSFLSLVSIRQCR